MSKVFPPFCNKVLVPYILAYDFVLLTETFSVDFPSHLFPLYTVFVSPGIKLTDAPTGRLSGGVALLVGKLLDSLSKFM